MERHVCSACAAKQEGGAGTFDLWDNDFFKSLVNPYLYRKRKCRIARLALTLDEFNENGRFGCLQCYTSFREQIMQMLPACRGARDMSAKCLCAARAYLRRNDITTSVADAGGCPAKEEYERAAELRDEIHSLQRSDDTGGI